jgi:acyl-CoA reductase-like NAD-dependent aldehyde dehydrogenase
MIEEQFGPLLPVQRFSDIEDAIGRANDTRYGLAASVWSRDIERAKGIALRLEAGTVWINQHRATAPNVPFGGIKESGLGRNYSLLGLRGNMEARVISVLKS